uniref:Uncharacterized protein n=1 Tax=Oryza meridionalis TaxID=40149 RepID=A0A0E0F887_9ORYZ
MTTAPHGLIGSRRAVGGEASTAVEETPAAAFCRRSPALECGVPYENLRDTGIDLQFGVNWTLFARSES